MKTKIKLKLFSAITFLMLAFAVPVAAQVTIGEGEAPEKGALLQLKDKPNVTNDGATASKGLVLPRVSLSNKKALYPMFLNDPSNPGSGDNENYNDQAKKDDQNARHTGMLVYNTYVSDPASTDYDNRFEEGVYTWDGSTWLLVTDETSQTVYRLIIPIGHDITTQTVAYYGEIAYSITPPDVDEYALLSLVPIVTGGTENFVPNNLFFSYSLRREEGSAQGGGSGKAIWKLKIDNRNTDDSNPDMHATVEEIHILYTARNGHFSPVPVSGAPDDVYVTLTDFNGSGTNP